MTTDVIDRLVGIASGDALHSLREQRPTARANAQASFDALLHSDDFADASQLERLAREKQSQTLADAARRLQDAANQMRRAAASGQKGTGDASQALQNLQDARRLLHRRVVAARSFVGQQIVLVHANLPTVTRCFDQLEGLISSRGLATVTLNDVFT